MKPIFRIMTELLLESLNKMFYICCYVLVFKNYKYEHIKINKKREK